MVARAAELMGFYVVRVPADDPELYGIAETLPVGKIFASGQAFVPFVARAAFDKLRALAEGGVIVQPPAPDEGPADQRSAEMFSTETVSTADRRGRNTHDALAAVLKQLHPTGQGPSPTAYVIEGDIKGCFDAIDHHLLMEAVKQRVRDRKILLLIRAFLKAGVMIEGSVRHPTTGTPQGGILSPLLANIFLHRLDERYGRWTPRPREKPTNAKSRRFYDRQRGRPTFYMVRYAEKTLITRPEDGLIFLGYRITRAPSLQNGGDVGKLRIPMDKLKALRREIKKRTGRFSQGLALKQLIRNLNPLIAGWRTYFQFATYASRDFDSLDHWLWWRIDRWLRKKHHKTGKRQLRAKFRTGDTPALRWRWKDGTALLGRFSDGGTRRYRNRGARIPNGWNDEEVGGPAWYVSPSFWSGYRATMSIR